MARDPAQPPAPANPANVAWSSNYEGVESGDVCRDLGDYEAPTSRVAIGLVLRRYLDSVFLTPFELLYSHRALKALIDSDAVYATALTKVAAAQSKATGEDPRQRRTVLQGAVEAFLKQARQAEAELARLPRSEHPCETCLESLDSGGAGQGRGELTAEQQVRLRAALCRELGVQRQWIGRIDTILDLAARCPDARLLPILDQVLADLLCTPAAVAAALGCVAGPVGEVLQRLLRVCRGEEAVSVGSEGPGRVNALSQMFRRGALPACTTAIREWCLRRLKTAEPLAPRETGREAEYFASVLDHFVTGDGVEGGSRMAEALTLRAARRSPQGGSAGLHYAVITISESLNDFFRRLQYLLAIAEVPAVAPLAGEVAAAIESALGNEVLIEGLLFRGSLADLRSRLERLANRMRAGSPEAGGLVINNVTEEERERLASRIERVADEYALSGRLISHLNAVERQLPRQAQYLGELVESGLIHSDGALPLIKQRLIEIIKQRPRAGAPGPGAVLPAPSAAPPPAPPDALTEMHIGVDGAPTLFTRSPILRPAAARNRPAAPVAAPPLRPARAPADGGGERTQVTELATAFVGRPAAALRPGGAVPVPAQAGGGPATPRRRSAADGTTSERRCPACFVVINESAGAGDAGSGVLGGKCPECGFDPTAERRPTSQLPPGTVVQGRYGLGRLLGQGGFGMTYLGWDARLQIKVAIKEYFPISLVSRTPGAAGVLPFTEEHAEGFYSGITKFLEEARILARFRDVKEIVGVQDFFEENNTAYLVMELLEGRTFKKLIQESGTLDYRRALGLLAPIMKALHEIHATGLVHRDVSPDNIFLTSAGEGRLLDFGAARQAVGEATAALTVILKPGYAPPEQYAQDGRQGPWTDVYAMAATLYCAITGKVPPDVAKRLQNDQVPRPAALGFRTPAAFDEALIQALSLRCQERPQSMKEFLTALTRSGG